MDAINRSETSLITTDSGVPLINQDFSSKEMSQGDFSRLQAQSCRFDEADLEQAVFSHAELKHCSFKNANLKNARFHFALLEGCDLSEAHHVKEGQFAGASLVYCKLPKGFSFPSLNYTHEAAKHLWNHQFLLFLACLYSCIAIASTTDTDLLHNANSVFFPLLEMSLPTVGFFYFAPFALLAISIFFQVELGRYWEKLTSLPAFFPDGSAITLKTNFTPADSLVEMYFPFFEEKNRNLFQKIKHLLSTGLLFFLTPLILVAYWIRYMPRHDLLGTLFHCTLIVVSIIYGFVTWRGIKFKMPQDGTSHRFPIRRFLAAMALISGGLAGWSFLTLTGPKLPLNTMYMDVSFKDLSRDFLIKENAKAPKENQGGVILDHFNLRYANMVQVDLRHGFLRHTIMDHSDLRKANLSACKLDQARLLHARLEDAIATKASGIRSDFSGAVMTKIDLSESVFSQSNFIGADLSQANIAQSDFSRCDLSCSSMDFMNATRTDFNMAIICKATLNKARLSHANLYLSHLAESHFWQADLTHATLILASATNSDFSGANLTHANLSHATLNHAVLDDADMSHAIFGYARLNHASLVNGRLRHADLSCSQLNDSTLTDADLTGADLRGAVLKGANLKGAILKDAALEGTDLREVHNLNPAQLKLASIDSSTLLPDHFNPLLSNVEAERK